MEEKKEILCGWFKIKSLGGLRLTSLRLTSARYPTTLAQAWRKTIAKWELISIGYTVESDLDTCGLCNLFLSYNCEGCPVYRVTKRRACDETPHRLFHRHATTFTAWEYAKAELNFLKAVRSNRGGTK